MRDEEKAKEITGKACRDLEKSSKGEFKLGLTAIAFIAATMEMAKFKNEKLDKLKRLADEMYFRMQTLSTDIRPLRKAMEDYHNFIIHEYDE